MATYRPKREPRRAKRQREAMARAEARAKRTPAQQLALIATRRGESKREKARLEKVNAGS